MTALRDAPCPACPWYGCVPDTPNVHCPRCGCYLFKPRPTVPPAGYRLDYYDESAFLTRLTDNVAVWVTAEDWTRYADVTSIGAVYELPDAIVKPRAREANPRPVGGPELIR